MKKLLSIILCLVLVCALLPTAALAYTYNMGNQVYLELKKDFSGSLPAGETLWTAEDFDNVPNDFSLQANWYLGGQLQTPGTKFQAGYTYELRLVMDSSAGSYNAVFENDGWAVILNGGAYSANAVVTSSSHAEASFNFSCQATIDELSITNIEMPLPGGAMQTSGFSFGPGSGMKQKGVQWYRTSKTDVPIPVSGSFEAGESYRLELTVGAPAGTIFNLTQNSVAAELGDLVGFTGNGGGEVTVRINFDVPAADKISSVGVSIPAPAVGEYASFIASASGAGYQVNEELYSDNTVAGIAWYEGAEKEPVPKGSKFEAGKSYTVIVNLIPEPGYEFINSNPNGYSDAVSATINGSAAESWGTETALRVSCTFPALPETKKEIDGVSVTVTAPAADANPVYSAAPGLGGQYTVDTGWVSIGVTDGVGWALMNSKTWNDIDQPMTASDKFQVGEIYMVCVALKPNSGYTFASGLVSDPSKALVNGYGAAHVEKNGDGIIVYYVYPPAAVAKTLESIAVTKAPTKTSYKVGEAFDPAGMVVTATYADKSTAAVTGYTVTPAKLAATDKTVTISYTEGKVTKTTTQAVTVTDDKTVATVAVTIAAPKVGEKASLSATVPTDAKYTVKSVQIFCDEENADLKNGDVYGKKTYIVNVTLAPAAGYGFAPDSGLKGTLNGESAQTRNVDGGVLVTKYFMLGSVNPFTDVKESDYYYDAVIWAYYAEPQVTMGIGGGLFGPDSTVKRCEAVTFLWRAVGCPEPKIALNPFVDVTAEDYFYKPVLWAVEKGITVGTDDTHFSPNQTCSTAHIITFLYRALGIGDNGWYEVAEAWAKGAGLLDGLKLAVAPGVDCPRRDVVLFLYRAVGK